MSTRIQVRRDTTAAWTAADPVLAQGEFALDVTTGTLRIGDGASTWSELAEYAGGGGSTTLDGLTDVATTGAATGEALIFNGTSWVPSAAAAVLTDDARLTDSRAPEAHAASHATGGSDALTPADIGAEPAKGVDDNYVTAAEKAKLGNLSGTNTGDQDLSGYSVTGHTHAAADVTDLATAVGSLTDIATANASFGSLNGSPIPPWYVQPVASSNYWRLNNFHYDGNYSYASKINTTTLTPSIATNGTARESYTLVKLLDGANIGQNSTPFRLEFDYDGSTATGWWEITVALRNQAGGAIVTGSTQQAIITGVSAPGMLAGHFIMDFLPNFGSSETLLEVRLYCANNGTTGTLSISNVSVVLVTEVSRPMNLFYSDGQLCVQTHARDVVTDTWHSSAMMIGGQPSTALLNSITGWDYDAPWRRKPADPMFLRPKVPVSDPVFSYPPEAENTGIAVNETSLRIGNNDQIIQAKSLNGSYEGGDSGLYGNVHGGETTTASTIQVDYGNGSWVTLTPYTDMGLKYARRIKASWTAELKCDSDASPFAIVTHTSTFFPDGVMRHDRTTTFQRDTTTKTFFEWMSSHNPTEGMLGRIGRGMTVLGHVDSYAKVAQPAAPTVTTATTGGSLAAATYSYRVAALSAEGETTASAAGTVVTTGSTSTATVTWVAVSGATGYRVYGRTSGVEALLTTAGPAATSWVDDGTSAGTGRPKPTNTARTPTGVAYDLKGFGAATWAAWYKNGWCYGNIMDRDGVLARDGVGGIKSQVICAPGIQKQYNFLIYDGGATELTIPSGTAWTATHWSFTYRPEDRVRWHNEIAQRAASIAALKDMYPTT